MDRSGTRAGRISRSLAVRCLAALLLVVAPLTFPTAGAAFTASSGNGSNTVGSGAVAAPSGFSAVQDCAATGIAFRAATSNTGTTGALTLSTPPATEAGDILVAHVTNRYDASYTITPSSGTWTLVSRISRGAGASSVTSAVLWKLATASEPATVTFTLSGSMDVAGGLLAYSGVHTTSPINASGQNNGSGTLVTTASVSTTVTGTTVVHAVTKRDGLQPTLTGTSGRWGVLSPTSGDNQGSTVGDESVAGTGPIPSRSSTAATASDWIAQTIALRPAPNVPSASLAWTASPTTGASGYRLERVVSGSVIRTWTVTPISSTSSTDGPLTNGTAYTYRLRAYRGTWNSPTITAALTPSC